MEVVTLFLIGIILIAFNVRAVSKEKNSFGTQLKYKEGSVKDFDLEVGKLRHEFGETIFELQKQIENLKNEKHIDDKKDGIKNEIDSNIDKDIGKNIDKKDESLSNENLKFENYNNVKIDDIKKMLDDKVAIEKISEITGIGKGELLLIKELYVK
ncbi:hypothetical protein J2Z42_000063 [Clostridium algifaecis]|uniref:Helix-hairpin-helix domain-containing protein n=1 Tax=Clostridium algifaecis TaxID=1472040 RepID=A0ABS4KMY1_9CLOT|nr:hypothetical protein [Clostridium algifaecis]MBP2031398.1 hypothetical protein [Clostridium algifaecis]